jgi:mannose-6-phosphate isomerase
MEKKLYPFKFIPVASRRPWGGSALVRELGKNFVECDEEGNEVPVGEDALIGESWEIADMGIEDSVLSNGWLAGNTISELMETYLERIVGEDVYNYFGRQFPLLIKFLDINDRLSVQVHPDDEIAAERYDSLGKAEIWYVMDAKPGAKMYMGFSKEMTAQEFYDRCKAGTVEEVLNVVEPKKGDVIYITPGTVHAADAGLLIAEIQESSDMTFRLYDWGREFNPETARETHLEEAIDVIDYRAFDSGLYRKGPLWGDEASYEPCHVTECHCGCHGECDCGCHGEGECHCGDECHCEGECHCGHEHHHHSDKGQVAETLVESPQFNVTKINLTDPLHIYTEKFESFIIYICVEGAASVQVPSVNEKGEACMDNYEFAKGETIMIPADMQDFFLVPRDRETIILEAVTRPVEEQDGYINPDTEAFLEGEDYEGLEDGLLDDEDEDMGGPSGASPLGFFGSAMRS